MLYRKILLLLLACLPLVLQAQTIKKTLLIGIDGCRPDALQTANTPNLDRLIANGIYSPDALNDDITYSGPGWSAIVCGVWSNKHLVTNNFFLTQDYDSYPSIIKRIEDYNPSLTTASICHWNPINDFMIQGFADYKANLSTDQDVSNDAVNYLTNNDPDFMFLHFDDVDAAGHSNGFSSTVSSYISAIEGVDANLGPVLDAIENRPNYANEDWLILVTTDHGGLGLSHGGTTIQEEKVFVIVSGNSVDTQLLVRDSTVTVNPTTNCLGTPTELQMDGEDDYVQIPNNSLFNFDSNQDFTIECRVRTDIAADVAIVGNKDWTSGNSRGFAFSFKYDSGPEWKVNIADGFFRADINTGGAIADGDWHTLSVTFDRSGSMRMYEDGVFLDQTSISFVGNVTTNEGLFFGTDVESDFDYTGAIAEVRVWNKVLNATEIGDWYCSSLDNTHSSYNNLIGYWKMDEGSGNTVIDHSTYGNNGNIQGASWESPGTTITYDYSNTPRLVDMVPTALTHMCIPIDPAWGLDGKSLVGECVQMDLAMKVFLEGAVNASGTMTPDLYNKNLLTQHPYDASPYNYTGPSLSGTIPVDAVDYILIELRRGAGSNNTVIHQQVAFVLSNGEVVLEDGSLPSFLVSQSSNFQVWLRHHNHLDVLADGDVIPAPLVAQNFLLPSDVRGIEQLKDMGNGVYALFSGDINQDGIISVTDYDDWVVSPAILNEYTNLDTNLDGSVQITDYDTWYNNRAKVGYAQNQ